MTQQGILKEMVVSIVIIHNFLTLKFY